MTPDYSLNEMLDEVCGMFNAAFANAVAVCTDDGILVSARYHATFYEADPNDEGYGDFDALQAFVTLLSSLAAGFREDQIAFSDQITDIVAEVAESGNPLMLKSLSDSMTYATDPRQFHKSQSFWEDPEEPKEDT